MHSITCCNSVSCSLEPQQIGALGTDGLISPAGSFGDLGSSLGEWGVAGLFAGAVVCSVVSYLLYAKAQIGSAKKVHPDYLYKTMVALKKHEQSPYVKVALAVTLANGDVRRHELTKAEFESASRHGYSSDLREMVSSPITYVDIAFINSAGRAVAVQKGTV